jgi:hypothetical protein
MSLLSSEVVIVIEKSNLTIVSIDQILAELIQAGVTLCSQNYDVINFVWSTEGLPQKKKESVMVGLLNLLLKRVKKLFFFS